MKHTLHIISAVALALTWSACSPKPPSQQDLKNRLAPDLPPYLTLQNLELETSPSGEGRYTCKFRATVQPTEDLFVPSSSRAANEMQIHLVERLAEDQISQGVFDAATKVITEFSDRHSYIKVEADKSNPITLHGGISATRGDQGWQWGFPEWSRAVVFEARPRSAFPVDALVEGSPEATAALDGLRQKIQEMEKAERLKTEKATAEFEAKKNELVAMFRPGTRFKGHVKSENFPDQVEMVVAAESDPTGNPLKFRLINPLDETMYRDFVGVIDPEGLRDPKRSVAKASAQPAVGNFDDKRGLFAPMRTLYGQSAYSIQFFVTETGLRAESSGYGGAVLELVRQP